MRLSRLNLWSGLAAVSVPVGYIVYQHVSWEKTRAGKQAMLTHHLTFWSSVVAAIALLHDSFRTKKYPAAKVIGFRIAAALLPILGFWGGERLAQWGFSAKKQLEKQQLKLPTLHLKPQIQVHTNQYLPPFLRETESLRTSRIYPNQLSQSV